MLHNPFRLLLSIFLGIAALTQLVLSAPTKGVTENTKVLGLKATNFESKARVLLYSSDKQTAWGRFPEYRNKADTQEIINAVKEVALAGYGYFSGTSGYFKTNLVAAMYDDQNGIFFSTIPHGKYLEELDGDIKKAREWRAKRQQLRQECKPEDKVFEESNSLKPNAPGWDTAAGQKKYKPHAEDGVLYYYEKATGTRTSEVAERKETECWWLKSPKTYMSVIGLMPGEHFLSFFALILVLTILSPICSWSLPTLIKTQDTSLSEIARLLACVPFDIATAYNYGVSLLLLLFD